jgi:hypothetical protein
MQPRWCNHEGCATRIILALRADTRRWVPYEATEREPGSLAAAGAHVLVGNQAWTPADLREHFRVQFEISREKAEALVIGYPHHRPHFHLDD